MPTTYAHWRFGCDCIQTLPDELKGIILKNRRLFDLGVHGPDIFFYDLKHDDVAAYGGTAHHEPGRVFFGNSIRVYNQYDDEKDAMLAYMLGFLSHYALDSQCHGYVNRKDLLSDTLSHNSIEAYYDGHLMKKDSKSIPSVNRADSLRPDRFTAKIIARFFPFDEETLYRTTKNQRILITGLYCRTKFKRKALEKVLRKMGKDDHADLIIQLDEIDEVRDSNLRLDKLTEYALELYPRLADNLCKALNGEEELLPYFGRDFDPAPSDDIPVLPYEEELVYIPKKDID